MIAATAAIFFALAERALPAPCAVELSVLTYNVRGLPAWVARDAPAERLRKIGPLLDRYELVLLQEDFVHRDELRAGFHHPIVIRGNGPPEPFPGFASLLCPWCGAGLTILAALPPESLLDVAREPFAACSGWLGRRGDCWVAKGILRARWALSVDTSGPPPHPPASPSASPQRERRSPTSPFGERSRGSAGEGETHSTYPDCRLELDVYNVHMDAGPTAEDRAARARQLAQLRERVMVDSAGRALIVAGDFNSWPEEPDDRRPLDDFVAALDLLPAPIPPIMRGWPPVDRIFYRSGDAVDVEALSGTVPADFVDDGRPLSDHLPLQASFRLSARAAPRTSAAPSPDRRR